MYYQKYGNKYKNIRQTYNGRSYASKLEAQYAYELDLRKKAGEVIDWKPQFKVDLRVNGIHITNHYVDFWVKLKDGSEQLVECKGLETDLWRIKRNLLEATFLKERPEIEYIVVK